MENFDLPNLLDNNQDLDQDPTKDSYKLKVFFDNDVPRRRNNIPYQWICYALSTIQFLYPDVFVQFWAAIDFKYATTTVVAAPVTATVLTTKGQPFGYSTYTNEIWSYRKACLDHNSYLNYDTKLCIGVPARVFLNRYPEWAKDIRNYNGILYPQLDDATRSNIRGLLVMPVINEVDRCIGVLEFVIMTNLKDKCFHEMMSAVCRALEAVGLKSIVQNVIYRDTSIDYSSTVEFLINAPGGRKAKSCKVTCNDITKVIGMSKADAAKNCHMSENTFTKVHRRYGIDVWPCVRKGVEKSYAHNALERETTKHICSDEALIHKHMNDFLMQHNDDINCNDDIVDKHNGEFADGKRVREQHDESPNPDVLEPYYHINKRSRI